MVIIGFLLLPGTLTLDYLSRASFIPTGRAFLHIAPSAPSYIDKNTRGAFYGKKSALHKACVLRLHTALGSIMQTQMKNTACDRIIDKKSHGGAKRCDTKQTGVLRSRTHKKALLAPHSPDKQKLLLRLHYFLFHFFFFAIGWRTQAKIHNISDDERKLLASAMILCKPALRG